MILIRRAIVAIVVLNLLLPSSWSSPTTLINEIPAKKKTLENEGASDNFTCSSNQTTLSANVCDGKFDCYNGMDEICYSGKCGDINQCQCMHTNKCIQRNQSHVFIFDDYPTNSQQYVHAEPNDELIIECPIPPEMANSDEITWYRNDINVPPKCKSKTGNRASQLTCPNMTIQDEGVYSCAYYTEELFISIDVMVFLSKKMTFYDMGSCFCFEAPKNCEKVNVIKTDNEVPMLSNSTSQAILLTINSNNTMIPNYTIFKGKKLGEIASQDNGIIYYSLYENITDLKLNLYGGYLAYELSLPPDDDFSKRSPVTDNNTAAPLALMRGGDKELVYYDSGYLNRNSTGKRLSFANHNWLILDKNGEFKEMAREDDVMEVLRDLQAIYIRLNGNLSVADLVFYKGYLYTVEFVDNGRGMPSSIGRCSCPTGYIGNFCQKKNESKADDLENVTSSSEDEEDHESSDENEEPTERVVEDQFQCPGVDNITEEKLCNGIFDCPDGSDEKCIFGACTKPNECLCSASKKCISRDPLHLYLFDDGASPYLNPPLGQSMTLNCPIGYATEINWYRNDVKVPSDCVITNGNGSSAVFCSNVTSLHEGVYSCERFSGSINDPFYLTVIQTAVMVGKGPFFKECYCFGATNSCELSSVTVADFDWLKIDPWSPRLLLTQDNLLTLSLIEEMPLDKNNSVYYPLSEEMSGNKLELFGGFILYEQQTTESTGNMNKNVNAPLAVMQGDDKDLLYNATYNSTSKNIKLSFSTSDWYILSKDGKTKTATASDIMAVLRNLTRIYIRLDCDECTNDELESKNLQVYKINFSDSGTLSYIGKCSCPPEYVGTYCESCAENYIRADPLNDSCVPVVHKDGGIHDENPLSHEDARYNDPTDDMQLENRNSGESFGEGGDESSRDKTTNPSPVFPTPDAGKADQSDRVQNHQTEESACENNEIQCENGEPIPATNVRNGNSDCVDENDTAAECNNANKLLSAETSKSNQQNQSHDDENLSESDIPLVPYKNTSHNGRTVDEQLKLGKNSGESLGEGNDADPRDETHVNTSPGVSAENGGSIRNDVTAELTDSSRDQPVLSSKTSEEKPPEPEQLVAKTSAPIPSTTPTTLVNISHSGDDLSTILPTVSSSPDSAQCFNCLILCFSSLFCLILLHRFM